MQCEHPYFQPSSSLFSLIPSLSFLLDFPFFPSVFLYIFLFLAWHVPGFGIRGESGWKIMPENLASLSCGSISYDRKRSSLASKSEITLNLDGLILKWLQGFLIEMSIRELKSLWNIPMMVSGSIGLLMSHELLSRRGHMAQSDGLGSAVLEWNLVRAQQLS